ncbi:MAG: TauD/TfdA family dioxygenase [Roseovarius sp.]|uniref:TauD/TfdA family dioxygenase n=1 Tax=Roseovarius sp. TaxID=1486281 RepID=UPI004059CFE7
MTHAADCAEKRVINVTWDDGLQAEFPYIWLIDSDPVGFHPDTKERSFDLTTVDAHIAPTDVQITGDQLSVSWSGAPGHSALDLTWLRDHRPGQRREDPANVAAQTWRAELGAAGVPRWQAHDLDTSDEALVGWMKDTRRYGLSIVAGLPDDAGVGWKLAERIGYLRITNFGDGFEVKSMPNPTNLAFTALALPLHTDLPYQECPPGYQFLHCIANEAEGGESVFCDGFAVAEDFRRHHPDEFALLTRVAIPFRYHDDKVDIRSRHPILVTDSDGQISEICFNAHIGDVVDLEPGELAEFYPAYLNLMRLIRDPAYAVSLKLRAGEMVVFDNRRVLHGRSAFDPNTGFRHLHGCYVDRGDFDSKLRLLARA